jgi:hypothetical protein
MSEADSQGAENVRCGILDELKGFHVPIGKACHDKFGVDGPCLERSIRPYASPSLLHHEHLGIFAGRRRDCQHGETIAPTAWHGAGDLSITFEFEGGGITGTERE